MTEDFVYISTDEIFFSHIESAEKYARADPNERGYKKIYQFSYPGQILMVRQEDGSIERYIIDQDRSLRLIPKSNMENDPVSIYTKKEIDAMLT